MSRTFSAWVPGRTCSRTLTQRRLSQPCRRTCPRGGQMPNRIRKATRWARSTRPASLKAPKPPSQGSAFQVRTAAVQTQQPDVRSTRTLDQNLSLSRLVMLHRSLHHQLAHLRPAPAAEALDPTPSDDHLDGLAVALEHVPTPRRRAGLRDPVTSRLHLKTLHFSLQIPLVAGAKQAYP